MRWVPVAAWIFTLVGLLLSLVTLLIGIEGSSANSAPIAKVCSLLDINSITRADLKQYNVSSLGLAEFHDSSSELGRNISALIPTDADTSVSITQYLGAKDWYTVHYLSICSGFFAPSKSDPSILTRSTVNVTCVRQSSGYTFSLAGILRDGLKPSVQSLVEGIDASTKSYHTAPWINLWYAGMVFAFLEAALLPFTFSGERRINMHSFFVSLVSTFHSQDLALSSHLTHSQDLIHPTRHSIRSRDRTCSWHPSLWLGIVSRSISWSDLD